MFHKKKLQDYPSLYYWPLFFAGAARHRLKCNLRFFPPKLPDRSTVPTPANSRVCASQPQAFSRRHFKPSEQMRSPDGAKIKYNRWLHNRKPFPGSRLWEDVLFYSDKNVSSNSARSVFKQRSELSPKKKSGKLDKSRPSRHQMTALHWKLSENDFLRPPRRYPWAAAG